MKYIYIIFILFVFMAFQNCKKENMINKKMEGNWNLTSFNRAGGYTQSDFTQDKMSFIFSKYKKAYTSTMRGVFIIDYADISKNDVRDTFEYQLKGNEIDITKIITKGTKQLKFIKNRFKIEEYKNDKLKLVRIDSIDLYIKATK